MEYRKSSIQKDVVRSRYNTLWQVLQNAAVKRKHTTTSQAKTQRKCTESCVNKSSKNKCQDLNVRETYDEVLDLRNAVLSKESSRNDVKKCVVKKPSNAEPTLLDKVCEFPNMHYKIMTLCSVKNSSKFSERFNAKTNIISEKIVNKQLELQAAEKPSAKTKTAAKSRPKFGENTVIQNILKKEDELQRKNVVKTPLKLAKTKPETKISEDKVKIISKPQSDVGSSNEDTPKSETRRPRFQLSTKPEAKVSKTFDCYDIARSRFQRSIMAGMSGKARMGKTEMPTPRSKSENLETSNLEMKKSNASRGEMKTSRPSSWDRSRPRFLLSTKSTRRCAVSHSSIQVNMEKSSSCINTQTENIVQLKNMSAQTYMKNITNEKKMQTRICKTDSVETGPILIEGPAKYTSTTCDYYHSEQPTQMYQHLTTSDLVCLDWVNRHLFGVNVNPHNIIVDDKIKEVSEVASKSTFLSEMKPLALPK